MPKPKKKIQQQEFRLVRLLADIRYRTKADGSKLYLKGAEFELLEVDAQEEKAAGRVEFVTVKKDAPKS